MVMLLSLVDMLKYVGRLRALDEECYETMKHSYRVTTLKNYRSQALIYSRFCEFYGLPMFPATDWQLVRYARYIANTVTSYDTVNNYVSGVRRLHQLGGFPVPTAQEPNFQHIMRAIKHELAHPVKQAAPMTPELLRRIYHVVDFTDTLQLVAFVAVLLGFYMFLRKSNLVPDTRHSFCPDHQLTRSDVRIGNSLVVVEIRWSKTLQYKQKELLLPLLPLRHLEICPIYWLRVMINRVKARPRDPLFAVPEGDSLRPLTYDQLQKTLRAWVTKTGEDPAPYSLHCLRRGGSTFAIESGLVSSDLKVIGDWASDSYMRYIDSTLQRRIDGMVKFMDHL